MKWQEPRSGLSWTDVLAYLTAMDSIHGSTSWLDLSSAGSSYATTWRVFVVSVFPALGLSAHMRKVVSSVTWPNVDSASLEGAIYKALVDHDNRISREVYTQGTLPGA